MSQRLTPRESPGEEQRLAPAEDRMSEDRDRRQAGQPVVAAERVGVAEDVEERDVPGDGAERQVMAREAQRDRADDPGGRRRQQQRHRQREPRRQASFGRQQGRGVGADADEHRLPEGGDAGDPGEHDEPGDHDGREAGIGQQREPERRHAGQEGEGDDQEGGQAGQNTGGSEAGGHLTPRPRSGPSAGSARAGPG